MSWSGPFPALGRVVSRAVVRGTAAAIDQYTETKQGPQEQQEGVLATIARSKTLVKDAELLMMDARATTKNMQALVEDVRIVVKLFMLILVLLAFVIVKRGLL